LSEENGTEENSDSKGIASLRKEFEKLQKQLAERDAEVTTLRTEKRQGSVVDALKAKGLSEDKAAKTAKFYSGDDASEEAVGKWLTENADVFGVTSEQQAPPPGDPNAANAQPVTQAAFGATPQTNAPPNSQVIGDPAEFQRLYETATMEQLQAQGLMPKNLSATQSAMSDW